MVDPLIEDTIPLSQLIEVLSSFDKENILIEVKRNESSIVLPVQVLFGVVKTTGLIQQLHEDSGMLQSGGVLDVVLQTGIVGNTAAVLLGGSEEVWEIRAVSLLSAAGATYSIEVGGVIVAPGVAIGAAALDELISVPLPVAGDAAITIDNGLIGDAWNMLAVRLK